MSKNSIFSKVLKFTISSINFSCRSKKRTMVEKKISALVLIYNHGVETFNLKGLNTWIYRGEQSFHWLPLYPHLCSYVKKINLCFWYWLFFFLSEVTGLASLLEHMDWNTCKWFYCRLAHWRLSCKEIFFRGVHIFFTAVYCLTGGNVNTSKMTKQTWDPSFT